MPKLTRREFITATTAMGGALAIPTARGADARTDTAPGAETNSTEARRKLAYTLNVNGVDHRVALDPRVTLLDALRDHIGLTGSKKGCDHGQCGACTVLLHGSRTLSCLTLAAMVGGRKVTTIEGLAGAGTFGSADLHPMQQAFIDHDAFQCGYCTPGQIMSAVACVNEGHAETAADIREYMSGNICRCAAYPNIVAAVEQARTRMRRA